MVPQQCIFNTGDIVDGCLTIVTHLGGGTFGDVYRVCNMEGREYALKILKLWKVSAAECENLRNRFKMEFDTGRIDSPYLAHSYSYGEVMGNPYILMELYSGGDLKTYALNHDVDWAVLARQILGGLSDLHASGKVHRDLKPENVLIREDGTAVLTDFGISGDRNKRMTERAAGGGPQQLFGTYPYMPPEQLNPPRGSQATVLPTTDIFSFGVMMYEIITGQLPFGPMSMETLHTYLTNSSTGNWDREQLNAVPGGAAWAPLIEGCLQPDFKQRLQSAAQVRDLIPGGLMDSLRGEDKAYMRVVNGLLLRVMQGEEYGAVYYLDQCLQSGRWLIPMGRTDGSPNGGIPIREIQSCYISRRHCTLEKDPVSGQWYIRDGQWNPAERKWVQSLNGTYVNSSEALEEAMPIGPGDIISLGDVKLRVEGY